MSRHSEALTLAGDLEDQVVDIDNRAKAFGYPVEVALIVPGGRVDVSHALRFNDRTLVIDLDLAAVHVAMQDARARGIGLSR